MAKLIGANATTALIALRGLAQLFGSVTTQNGSQKIQVLNAVADGIESGANVDEEMALVAVALKSGEPKDWIAAVASINENSRLLNLPDEDFSHSPPPGAVSTAPLGSPATPNVMSEADRGKAVSEEEERETFEARKAAGKEEADEDDDADGEKEETKKDA